MQQIPRLLLQSNLSTLSDSLERYVYLLYPKNLSVLIGKKEINVYFFCLWGLTVIKEAILPDLWMSTMSGEETFQQTWHGIAPTQLFPVCCICICICVCILCLFSAVRRVMRKGRQKCWRSFVLSSPPRHNAQDKTKWRRKLNWIKLELNRSNENMISQTQCSR